MLLVGWQEMYMIYENVPFFPKRTSRGRKLRRNWLLVNIISPGKCPLK